MSNDIAKREEKITWTQDEDDGEALSVWSSDTGRAPVSTSPSFFWLCSFCFWWLGVLKLETNAQADQCLQFLLFFPVHCGCVLRTKAKLGTLVAFFFSMSSFLSLLLFVLLAFFFSCSSPPAPSSPFRSLLNLLFWVCFLSVIPCFVLLCVFSVVSVYASVRPPVLVSCFPSFSRPSLCFFLYSPLPSFLLFLSLALFIARECHRYQVINRLLLQE